MTAHFFNEAKRAFAAGEVDWSNATIKALLLMTNTTADTDYDVNTVSAIGTLDEFDGAGYTAGHGGAGRKTVTATISETAGGPGVGFAALEAAQLTWLGLGAGTRDALGVLLIVEGTSDDSDAIPIAWSPFSSAYTASGNNLNVSWSSDVAVQFGFNA